MLGTSSIEIYRVPMKASLEDWETFMANDDDEPPIMKTANDKRGRRGYADEEPLAAAIL